MTREELIRFARRDWEAISRSKSDWWSGVKEREGAEGAIRAGDLLRRQVLASRPGWPSDESRRSDLETHVRVSEALRRAGRRWRS